jgi:hypothetical protein
MDMSRISCACATPADNISAAIALNKPCISSAPRSKIDVNELPPFFLGNCSGTKVQAERNNGFCTYWGIALMPESDRREQVLIVVATAHVLTQRERDQEK